MAPGDGAATPQHAGQHLRSKSSVIKSFVHRRQPSKGEALVPEPLSAEIQHVTEQDATMGAGRFAKNNPGALGELQKNQQEAAPRAPRASRDEPRDNTRERSRSPTKSVLSGNPFKPSSTRDLSKEAKSARELSPSKKKKSTASLAGLLTRPKSLRNLYKMAFDDEAQMAKDKENRSPHEPRDMTPPTPIYAQFASDVSARHYKPAGRASADISRHGSGHDSYRSARQAVKERPKSYQVPPTMHPPPRSYVPAVDSASTHASTSSHRSKALSALTGGRRGHSRTRSAAPTPPMERQEPVLDPKDIDAHLEAMLDRRNIPENQRYKMRNLNDTIKMEFIRQDWAEMQAAKTDRPSRTDSLDSKDDEGAVTNGSDGEGDRSKHSRGRSFTFSRGRKDSRSPSKKTAKEGTLGRHFRSKSTESVVRDRPTSSSGQSTSTSFLSKIKLQQGPADYVGYLRKVQKPEVVEVGKLHKLRLLLRNETVSWIEEFIQQGGMKEIVGLLNRIMEVEWR